MPVIMSKIPKEVRGEIGQRRSAAQQWGEFFDGQAYRFTQGRDFDCKPQSMYQKLLRVSKKLKKPAFIKAHKNFVYLQAEA